MYFKDSSGRTWSEPIPEHVQIEMAACLALGHLEVALAEAKTIMATSSTDCEALATEGDAKLVHAKWTGNLADTTRVFRRIDISGQALIDAVRKMLNV